MVAGLILKDTGRKPLWWILKKNPTQLCLQPCASIEKIFLLVIWNSVCDIYQEISKHPLSFSLILFCTHLIGAAAAVELAVEPLVVPNFSCRRRTSRGGLAAEFTYAILTWRPVRGNNTLGQTLNSLKNIKKKPSWIITTETNRKSQNAFSLCFMCRFIQNCKSSSHLWVCWHAQTWYSVWASLVAPRARRAASGTTPSMTRTPAETPAWSRADSDASTARPIPPWTTKRRREESSKRDVCPYFSWQKVTLIQLSQHPNFIFYNIFWKAVNLRQTEKMETKRKATDFNDEYEL